MNAQTGSEPLPFDITASPLEGIHLIEAGAGTGKTYALTALFIRLVLEGSLPADRILVVTYTVAATKELRGRIRQKMRDALDAFLGGKPRDAFIAGLLERNEAARAVPLLEEALRGFDLASIFTIHGFCQRMLRENAFESGSTFNAELLADDSELRSEVLDDFWRTRFYPADPDFFGYARNSCTMRKLRDLLSRGTAQPRIAIIPPTGPVSLPPFGPLREMFRGLQEAWPGARDAAMDAMCSPSLNKTKYGDPGKYLAGLDSYLSGSIIFPLCADAEKFTQGYMDKAAKKGCVSPRHPFFGMFENFAVQAAELQGAMDRKIISLKGEMFEYFRTEFARRKERLNILSFEDLLARMDSALQGPRGEALAAAVRRRYQAALVDEFQDTDPVQYSIFRRIFGNAGDREGGAMFLIGDPKQAIFGFRGADLFTYLHASAEIASRHTLLTNRRSEPLLIEAVNTVFARADNPFLFREIAFRKADFPPHEKKETLTFNGRSEPPFHIWMVPGKGDKALAKGRARRLIARAVALEIRRLVDLGRQGEAMLGGRPLREADIAVIVRKHREARMVQAALREAGIHSVLYSDADLFDSDEAADLELVLRAAAEPDSETFFRAALATDLIGLPAEALEALLADASAREERQARLRKWRETWERSGFLVMYRRLLAEERVRERLIGRRGGERKITNYLHLGEVLHREAAERNLGMASLVDWLALRRAEKPAQAPEERQLRLESDADALKVITIHMSKGLEFPIVFCPFNWDGRMENTDYLLYHDRVERWKLNLDLNPPVPETKALSRMEILAENVRLLYVSLTRARNRCYLVWGRISDSFTSAAAYILHPVTGDPENVVDALGEQVKNLSGAELGAALNDLQEAAPEAICVTGIPTGAPRSASAPPAGEAVARLREFRASVERDWGITSFSALSAGAQKRPELPDRDSEAAEPEPPGEGAPFSITAFPRGAIAGTFFHRLFEEMDFRDPAVLEEFVGEKLAEHGYGNEWGPAVTAMIRNVLAADLDGEGLRLSAISTAERLSELGFYIPLRHVSPESLGRTFGRFAGGARAGAFPRRLESLEFAPCRGFMRGFIDLVFTANGRFHLVDWKSNFLGHRPQDYSREKIAASMEEHLYFLQYHLYCLALHKYLQKRLPGYSYENHFGGVFYIYMRGFGEPGSASPAIFRDRPAKALMEALEETLIRVEGNGDRHE